MSGDSKGVDEASELLFGTVSVKVALGATCLLALTTVWSFLSSAKVRRSVGGDTEEKIKAALVSAGKIAYQIDAMAKEAYQTKLDLIELHKLADDIISKIE